MRRATDAGTPFVDCTAETVARPPESYEIQSARGALPTQ
jgi:hypothetical protein